jgi:hypothetical protein
MVQPLSVHVPLETGPAELLLGKPEYPSKALQTPSLKRDVLAHQQVPADSYSVLQLSFKSLAGQTACWPRQRLQRTL